MAPDDLFETFKAKWNEIPNNDKKKQIYEDQKIYEVFKFHDSGDIMKIKYEPFSSLGLPIPEGKNIINLPNNLLL